MKALDASAILAFMFGEPGHEAVEASLADACASTVNLAEVIARFTRDGHSGLQVQAMLEATAIRWLPFDVQQAALSADLLPRTKGKGLSLGDRACLALALSMGCPAVTADAQWKKLDLGIDVELIR